MRKVIGYYMSPISPWTYLGGKKLPAVAADAGVEIDIRPIDVAVVFQASGGLPLPKRHPSRQAYRMFELRRWRDHYGVDMNVEPKFFPTDPEPACRFLIAAKQAGLDAVALSNAVMACVWERELDIAQPETLMQICRETGTDLALLEAAGGDPVSNAYDTDTQAAIDAGVFGVPWYVYDGVPYWGQDRLDHLAAALAG